MSVLTSHSFGLRQHNLPSHVDMHEFTDLQCAASYFVESVPFEYFRAYLINVARLLESQPGRTVRLHCTVPTSTSSETCDHPIYVPRHRLPIFCAGADLHDLHELRSRSLIFVHDIRDKLGSTGVRIISAAIRTMLNSCCIQIQVSYRLVPSHTSLVLLRALPEERVPTKDEPQALEQAKLGGRCVRLVKAPAAALDIRCPEKRPF